MSTVFNLYVLPVSGGGFPVQLAGLSETYEALKINKGLWSGSKDYSPDLVCAASGGNVAAYLALAADWNIEGIYRILENVDSKLFVRSWWPENLAFMPTWMLSIFTGTLYQTGTGPSKLLEKIFNSHTIQNTEILTLTFNKTEYIPQIFSNVSPDSSLLPIQIPERDKILYDLQPIIYVNGDLVKISEVCMASAAIPLITQEQIIDDCGYGDGGISASSPLSLTKDLISQVISRENKFLHLFYYASYNLDDKENNNKFTYRGKSDLQISLLSLVHSKLLNDRANAVELLNNLLNRPAEVTTYKNVDTNKFAEILESNKQQHCVFVFYPQSSEDVNIINFTFEDTKELIDSTRKNYNLDVWS